MRITSLLLAAAALCCVYREARAAVIAIDFGSEWMKIALVKVRRLRDVDSIIYVVVLEETGQIVV